MRSGLARRVRALEALTLTEVVPRTDSRLDGLLDPLLAATLRAMAQSRIASQEALVVQVVNQIDRRATRGVDRAGLAVPRVGGRIRAAFDEGQLGALVEDRVALIKTIDVRYFDRLEELLREAVEGGQTARGELAKRIRALSGASLSDARRIARDQVGTINSAITRKRYTDAGITRYRWATVRDEAVREAHRELHGQVFDLSGPGAIGAGVFGQDIHPGEDIQCRCRSIPLFDDEG